MQRGPELSLTQLERLAKQADYIDDETNTNKTEAEINVNPEKKYQSANPKIANDKKNVQQGVQGDEMQSEEEEKEDIPLLNTQKLEKRRFCDSPNRSRNYHSNQSISKSNSKSKKNIPKLLQSEKLDIFRSNATSERNKTLNLDSNNNSKSQIVEYSAKQMNEFLKGSIEHKMQKGSYGKPRYCKGCTAYKPDRSHHCSICNCCILKMDHHCPFVNNCIGFYNYKYFFNLLLYGSILLNIIVFTFHEAVALAIRDPSVSYYTTSTIVIVYSLMIVLDLVVTMFFLFHFWLLINGLSTIEFREKLSRNYRKVSYSSLSLLIMLDITPMSPQLWAGIPCFGACHAVLLDFK